MEDIIEKDRPMGGYTLRKIPVSRFKEEDAPISRKDIDDIKLIELSNIIDKWEQEVLFSDGGFYSLDAREAQEKKKDFILELKSFIETETDKIKLLQPASKEAARELKRAKMSALENQMELYTAEKLHEWENEVYENALDLSIKRAVLYKKNPEEIVLSLKNGLKTLEITAEKDKWSRKLYSYKKKYYKSDFYTALIKAFLKDKDINACSYFNTFKNSIISADKDKLEISVNELRIGVTAYNWAKEAVSYNYASSEYEKELNNIEDENIRAAAKQFYSDLKQEEKRLNKLKEKEKNAENWKEIKEAAKQNPESAALLIDYTLSRESIRLKKEYIKQRGAVKTDIKAFLKLFEEAFKDFQAFKDKDISDFRGSLNENDFEIFEKLQKFNFDEFKKADFDYKYALSLLKERGALKDGEKYDLISMYFVSKNEYAELNKKEAGLDARRKIVETICGADLRKAVSAAGSEPDKVQGRRSDKKP